MSPPSPTASPEQDHSITAVVQRERSRLGSFIRRRVLDPADAEDILQDVFHEFVQAYRLPEPVELASAWLFRVARNRIIDRFRKKKEEPLHAPAHDADGDEAAYRLDLALPSPDGGPEAQYARAALLKALQQAVDDLPAAQREVFVGHEIEGRSFKEMAAESGVPLNTLLARKRYAVLQLRTRLQSAYDEFET